jgi:hypothetical protein
MTQDSRHDQASYERAKPYFKSALEHLLAAGGSVRDLTEFALERFGDRVLPHLRHFLDELRDEKVAISGLTESARQRLLGVHVSAEQRWQMIRDAAYFRAERRGFASGFEEDDWLAAEREIDAKLAEQTGLVERGKKKAASIGRVAEQELDDLRETVAKWMKTTGIAREGKDATTAKARARKPATKKATAKQAASKKAHRGKTPSKPKG